MVFCLGEGCFVGKEKEETTSVPHLFCNSSSSSADGGSVCSCPCSCVERECVAAKGIVIRKWRRSECKNIFAVLTSLHWLNPREVRKKDGKWRRRERKGSSGGKKNSYNIIDVGVWRGESSYR